MNAKTLYLAARIGLGLAVTFTGIAPLAAQLPTEKRLGILALHELPDIDDQAIFSSRLATQQAFVSMSGHPRDYRLDLSGRPIRPLSIGAQLDYSGSGLHRDLYAQIDVGVLIPIARQWLISGGIDGGFFHRHYRLEDIVTEHPDYGEALAEAQRQFTIGAHVGGIYRREDFGTFAFGTRVHLTADGADLATVTYLRYQSPENGLRKTVFMPWLEHGFYSRERTRHYYKVGLRSELFRGRFFVDAACEASKDVQTIAAAIGITLYKGLALHYSLDLPFRYNGRHAGAAIHSVALTYDLQRKTSLQPRTDGGR